VSKVNSGRREIVSTSTRLLAPVAHTCRTGGETDASLGTVRCINAKNADDKVIADLSS
jgi:hypothetical protein